MKLQVTPTVDGKTRKQFTTLINPRTGKAKKLSIEDALWWGNRVIQVNEQFCKGDPKDFSVKLVD